MNVTVSQCIEPQESAACKLDESHYYAVHSVLTKNIFTIQFFVSVVDN